ncbi:hypothetical protein AB2I57_25385, partial (plasmid) [Escherichia coli]
TSVLRSVIGWVFNLEDETLIYGFRIYREALSRFSCAASISNLTQGNYQPGDFLLVDSALELVPARMSWPVIQREISLSSAWPVLMMKITIWMEQNSQRAIFRKKRS